VSCSVTHLIQVHTCHSNKHTVSPGRSPSFHASATDTQQQTVITTSTASSRHQMPHGLGFIHSPPCTPHGTTASPSTQAHTRTAHQYTHKHMKSIQLTGWRALYSIRTQLHMIKVDAAAAAVMLRTNYRHKSKARSCKPCTRSADAIIVDSWSFWLVPARNKSKVSPQIKHTARYTHPTTTVNPQNLCRSCEKKREPFP
jgi:hypothetical protein